MEKKSLNVAMHVNETEMINFVDVIKEKMKEYIPYWLQIFNHLYRLLIIGGFGSRKTNSLFDP